MLLIETIKPRTQTLTYDTCRFTSIGFFVPTTQEVVNADHRDHRECALLSAQCISSIGQIIKSVCVSVSQ